MEEMLQISIKTETDVNIVNNEFMINPTSTDDSVISIYARINRVIKLIGRCYSVEDLIDIAGPENIVQTLSDNSNEYEYDCFESALECRNYNYLFVNKIMEAKRK